MLLSLFLALAATPADTLSVGSASVENICTLGEVYATDSLNMAGKTFDIAEVLDRNKHLVRRAAGSENLPQVKSGEALSVGADSLPVLRTLRFTLQTPRFVKGTIEVKNINKYKLYVNNRESIDGKVQLSPGRAAISLQVLTQKTDADTFCVKFIGDSLTDVQVNADGGRPYTMADMMLGEHYRDVSLSPSGKFLVTTSYYLKDDGSAQYVTELSEIATERVLLRRNEYVQLSWLSAEKDVLYYTRNGSCGRELVLFCPADGKERVLAEDIPEGYFSVSPNEDYLIFSVSEDGKEAKGSLKRLQEPDDRQPGWRNHSALWRYDVATGAMRRLTFGATSVWLSDISADGKKLLLHSSRFDASRAPFDRSTLISMDAYSSKVDTLLADTTFIDAARFSPDGSQLLISASPASFGGLGSEVKAGQTPNCFEYKLYLYDIASRTTTFLLPKFLPSVDDFTWARGDNKVYFVATDGSGRSLFSLDVKNKKTTCFELPVSYVQRFTLAENMAKPRVVFYGQTGERAREMFTAQLTSSKPAARRIGKINFDEMSKGLLIGSCYDWRFKATRGDSIDGFFFLPPQFDATKKYPLIVYYYGGCTPTSKCLEFQYPLQVLAGQGYVVYVPNPSGAIGYGQEFAARHVNTWGNESGDDIIEGTKAFCREHPYVDEKRIGCMGASYGGFMTEYLQTRTDLFAAAISHAGISNIASYWGGGYWGYSYGECAQYGSFPWNNPDLYVKQSPLFNADKIHTPLLLLHGTADTNVPTTESQQLFTALKILGREVAYVQIDGENHVITDYAKRLAWQDAIFAWFAKYLKNDGAWWDALDL